MNFITLPAAEPDVEYFLTTSPKNLTSAFIFDSGVFHNGLQLCLNTKPI